MADNEYKQVVRVYLEVIDRLRGMSDICCQSKDGLSLNFKPPAFKALLAQQGDGENYRYYMRCFRTFGWIMCQDEKFSVPRRINGQLLRMISVDHQKWISLKEMVEHDTYYDFLNRHMAVVERLLYLQKTSGKNICVLSNTEASLNVKSNDYRAVLKKYCDCMEEYQTSLEIFRNFEWILCDNGNFTKIKRINGEARRVMSIDYEKYKLMKLLIN